MALSVFGMDDGGSSVAIAERCADRQVTCMFTAVYGKC